MLRLIISKAILSAAMIPTFPADTVVVAVIDTGIGANMMGANFLCKEGHKDFTGYGLDDVNGHGTHISGVIDQNVKQIFLKGTGDKANLARLKKKKAKRYCQVILKNFHSEDALNVDTLHTETQALAYAIKIGANIINYSGGGEQPDKIEKALIEMATSRGIRVIVAAGNNGKMLGAKYSVKSIDLNGLSFIATKEATYYPAMYDFNVTSVGNLQSNGIRLPSSNFGDKVSTWEIGTDIFSYGTFSKSPITTLSGTSQAAAVHTGKVVKAIIANATK